MRLDGISCCSVWIDASLQSMPSPTVHRYPSWVGFSQRCLYSTAVANLLYKIHKRKAHTHHTHTHKSMLTLPPTLVTSIRPHSPTPPHPSWQPPRGPSTSWETFMVLYICVCVCVCEHAFVCVCGECVCFAYFIKYICVCVCVCVCVAHTQRSMLTHTHTHTHIHTLTHIHTHTLMHTPPLNMSERCYICTSCRRRI